MLIIGLMFILVACGVAAYSIVKSGKEEAEETYVPRHFNKHDTLHGSDRGQLNVLMSSARIKGELDSTGVGVKKSIKEEKDCLLELLDLDERISKNMEILNELAQLANDFSLPMASGKIAKHQLFGNKFLGIVRKKVEKVRTFKNQTDMSDKKIRALVVKAFTVEMNVMDDLIDRQSYTTAVSWEDLDNMVITFEKEIHEVQKMLKAGN